jgi:hypothetical protein
MSRPKSAGVVPVWRRNGAGECEKAMGGEVATVDECIQKEEKLFFTGLLPCLMSSSEDQLDGRDCGQVDEDL